MRLRLGYKYYWEVSGGDGVPCGLCTSPRGHSLHHYVLECPVLEHFRPEGQFDLPSMVTWFINNNVVSSILKEYPNFAPKF